MSKRRRRSPSIQTKSAFDLTNLLSRPWVPIVFFALLTAGYFYHILITGDVIYGSDTGAEFHREATNPLQKPWANCHQKTGADTWAACQNRPRCGPSTIPLSSSTSSPATTAILAGVISSPCSQQATSCISVHAALAFHPLAALIAGAAYASAPAFLSFSHAGHYAKMTVIGLFPPHVLGTQPGHGHAAHHLLFNPR